MDNEQKEIDASVRASRLHALVQTNEWGEFDKMMTDIYTFNLQRLIEAEDAEARGYVKCIDLIWSKLHDNIRYGDAVRKAMLERYKQKGSSESSPA